MGTELKPPAYGHGEWYASSAAENEKLVHTGKGVLWSLMVTNANAASRYVYVFDGTDTTGTVILGPIEVPSGKQVGVDIRYGREYSTGLFVGVSSTHNTYTDVAANEHRFNVGYKPLSRRDNQ